MNTFIMPTGRATDRQTDRHCQTDKEHYKLEMWATAKRDGHPAKCRWHPLFNAAKFG